MKKRIYTGYAIVTRDILDDEVYKEGRFGISMRYHEMESLKPYCRGDRIIVRTYRVVIARFVNFRWIIKYPHFVWPRRYQNPTTLQIWHLRIDWGVDYGDGYEREVVYQKED